MSDPTSPPAGAPPASDDTTGSRWPDMRWVRRAAVNFFVVYAAFALASWLFFGVRSLILMVLLAWFGAIAMEPAVEWGVRRGMRRGAATGLLMLGGFLAFALFIAVFGQLLFEQLAALVRSTPSLIDLGVRFINEKFGATIDPNNVLSSLNIDQDKINSWATDLAGGLFGVVNAVVTFVFRTFTVLLFAFYFSADGPRFRRWVASFFPPERQPIIDTVWSTALDKTGGYVVSRMILAGLSAVCTSIFLLAIGVPYWLPLGIWVGLVSQFVPTIGTYLAGALPAAIGLSESVWTGIWVIVFILGYQQLENYVFSPKISNRTMQIHPAVAFGAVIAGGALFGAWGAIVAIPAVASIQALFETYAKRYELVEARQHDEEDSAEAADAADAATAATEA